MRTNDFLIKHKHIFIYYEMYCSANKGLLQRANSRNIVYTDVSKPFYVEPQQTAKVVSKMLRSGYTPSPMDIKDFKVRFAEVQEVQQVFEKLKR